MKVTPVLSTNGLCKQFGGVAAVSGVGLNLLPGTVTALIGPNGAGKTTLINLLTGVLRPDGGTITLKGEEITRAPIHTRARLGMARTYQTNRPEAQAPDPTRTTRTAATPARASPLSTLPNTAPTRPRGRAYRRPGRPAPPRRASGRAASRSGSKRRGPPRPARSAP